MFRSTYISKINCITPIGDSLTSNWKALVAGKTAISLHQVGRIPAFYTAKFKDSPGLIASGFTLLESLLLQVARPLIQGEVLSDRVGIIISTTKGNIESLHHGDTGQAGLYTLAATVAKALGFIQKPILVSHACVSGLLAVTTAKRLIQMQQYDAVLVLAGDMVSEFVASGFNAFQAMSAAACRPFDERRDGVTLGEAVAAAWVTADPGNAIAEIVGDGAINDANHISGPSRTGEGLLRSIQSALAEAQLNSTAIDYISAHGTATIFNDEMEAIAFNRLSLQHCPVNSFKGYYGHTLGASGLLELVLAIQSMRENMLIPSAGFNTQGTSVPLNILQTLRPKALQYVLKTASGFGGSNAAMVVKKI
ncbi:beta-ketoacyl synthase N-terminal-like domain-containing protein [Sphingobacterium sp. Mn56C]|uniref:beta-ketoacyl synthase N-terminal-like domain-containing protein n=1 Tax=Sphingobacterium sp. Mn56C TaxID=3395261 RepID=UPI003BC338B8